MMPQLQSSALMMTMLLFINIVFLECLLAATDKHRAVFEEIKTYDADREIIYRDGSVQKYPVQHTTRSKVWIKGNKFRADRVSRSQNVKKETKWIDILTPDGIYRLYPETKTGTKTPGVSAQKAYAWTDPTQMLSAFKRQGKITKVAEAKVDGQACDVYRTTEAQVKDKSIISLWVRQSDSVVIRLESKSESPRSLTVTEYKNIQVGTAIPDSLFEVPRDYKISINVPPSRKQRGR